MRLTRKLADCIDGIDLSRYRVGERLDLTPYEARLLVAEGWAEPYYHVRDLRLASGRLAAPDPPRQCPYCLRVGAVHYEQTISGKQIRRQFRCAACNAAWSAPGVETAA